MSLIHIIHLSCIHYYSCIHIIHVVNNLLWIIKVLHYVGLLMVTLKIHIFEFLQTRCFLSYFIFKLCKAHVSSSFLQHVRKSWEYSFSNNVEISIPRSPKLCFHCLILFDAWIIKDNTPILKTTFVIYALSGLNDYLFRGSPVFPAMHVNHKHYPSCNICQI